MEADVVRWLQRLRHTVADESESRYDLSPSDGVYYDSVLDSAIDALFDFGSSNVVVSDSSDDDSSGTPSSTDSDSSTASVSDFEYYGMEQLSGGDHCSRKNDSAVTAWKNDLIYRALDGCGTPSDDDEQVSCSSLYPSFPYPLSKKLMDK